MWAMSRAGVFWPTNYVFVLGHMRSRSSLLAHLLGSHPEIAGYTESHIKYRNPWDTLRLRWHVGSATGSWPRGRWLLDKQLHNRMYIPSALRHSDRLRVLVMVRKPIDTLRSIIRMAESTGNRQDADPEQAAAYYCHRLATLTGLAIEFGDRALLLESDSLVDGSDLALRRVADHLSLSTPLTQDYAVRKLTGHSGRGDMSPNIHRGTIVRHPPTPRIGSPLSPRLVSVLQRSYEHFIDAAGPWVPAVGFPGNLTMSDDLIPSPRVGLA